LNKQIVDTGGLLDEVSVIVASRSYAASGDYAAALDAAKKFHDFNPDSPKSSEMNNLAIDTSLAWVKNYQKTPILRLAYTHLQTIMQDYRKNQPNARKRSMRQCENYYQWGRSLSSAMDYTGAIEKMEMVVSDYPDSQVSQDAYEGAAQAHYDVSKNLISSRDFQSAYENLQTIQSKYPQAKVIASVNKDMPDLLIDWGDELSSQEQYLDAIEKYQQVAQFTQDETVTATTDEKYQQAVASLARDAGTDGSTVIQQAYQQACNGEVVTDPSVDIFPEEAGKAMPCHVDDEQYVPYEFIADIPGTLRYVVSSEETDRRVQSCPYVTSYDRRTLERWQYGITVTVTSVKTVRFL
jgi:tetratricopeptide (TPR) repeat protein